MINLEIAEIVVTTIALLFVYFFSVTVTGALHAWVAKKMGDDTAENAGLLSLNPLVHINPIGLTIMIFQRFGWGNINPINAMSIEGRFRNLRLFIAYNADAFIGLCLALAHLIVLLLVLRPGYHELSGDLHFLSVICDLFLSGTNPLRLFIDFMPNHSSLFVIFSLIIMGMVFFNIFAASLNLIIGSFRYVLALHCDHNHSSFVDCIHTYPAYISWIFPIVAFFFLANPLRIIFKQLILHGAYIIFSLLSGF